MGAFLDTRTGQIRSPLRDQLITAEQLPSGAAELLRRNNPLSQGVSQGLYGMGIGDLQHSMLQAELAGDQEAMAHFQNQAQMQQANMQANAPRIQSFADVQGFGDARDYVLGAFGQGAASMAPALAGGVAGRLLGGAAGAFVGAAAPGYTMERNEAIGQ